MQTYDISPLLHFWGQQHFDATDKIRGEAGCGVTVSGPSARSGARVAHEIDEESGKKKFFNPLPRWWR